MEFIVSELLRLPEVQHLVFNQSPLILALFQIQFSPVLSIDNPIFVAPFQEAIQKEYPLVSYSDQVEYEVGINVEEAEIRKGNPFRQWRFSDKEDNWVVVLDHNFLTIETRAYEYFEDFIVRLRQVLAALVEHIRPTVSTRIGLRYINEIRTEDKDWSLIIRNELLGPLMNNALAEHTIQSIQEIQLTLPNEQNITIRHGYFPNGTVVQPRPGTEIPSLPFYLLDFDASNNFPLPDPIEMDFDAVCNYVTDYHQTIYKLFRWSVTEQYISSLGVRYHEQD